MESDEWTVNSPEHHNCFWTYLKYNNRSHTLNEIAHLLGISISAVTALEKKALAKLLKNKQLLNFKK
jgi:DNA-directed RNA polymerase sigma subunit (sigma70/sigma32)